MDSRLDTQYRIGMRVVKTIFAMMICLFVSLLTGDSVSMSISAVSALVTLRATQDETVRTGVFRLIGTIIGGFFGMLTVLIGLYLPYYSDGMFVIILPLMLLLDLYLCNLLKMQDSCQISCVVIIIIAARANLDTTIGGALIFTLARLRDTLVGVATATIMNIVPYQIVCFFKAESEASGKRS